ncbi:Sodium Bile acid symporter family protein [Marinomonas gallaica]|uniref:Sodium Bile acid symporter family protein n=1 Tax=Marinomonas gallaica TaxID=1806667 RepID=A0A1C3JMN7_9GAMM|nr:bile acid:sodium symporter family protein [Marinomonas gallaica]SBT16395.1 Sodium Bile acid symporter family protein [Marinomonas gallaica]SBT21443.1 Sodium Bile acid symporter family protein [Marinomonas gallaica]
MIIQLFPLWALLLSVMAYLQPTLFVDFKGYILPLLMVIMLAMGLTLSPKDFKAVGKNAKAVGVGVLLQFLVMPITALLIATLFGFDSDLTVGMLLVGSVAGGTSSNVMCYLAKGDTALSISMTAISTLLGVVFTPLLVAWMIGTSVDVPVSSMLLSLVKIVLVPVAIGVLLNTLAHGFVRRIEPALKYVSMFAIVFIIAIVVALSAGKIASVGALVAVAVILHNATGLILGYWVTAWLGFDKKVCRTIAFEVGLQNSGLASALAVKFFTPAAALPGSIFSVWHNISGSLLASYWSKKPIKEATE